MTVHPAGCGADAFPHAHLHPELRPGLIRSRSAGPDLLSSPPVECLEGIIEQAGSLFIPKFFMEIHDDNRDHDTGRDICVFFFMIYPGHLIREQSKGERAPAQQIVQPVPAADTGRLDSALPAFKKSGTLLNTQCFPSLCRKSGQARRHTEQHENKSGSGTEHMTPHQ